MPANLNVEGYEKLNIHIPSTCLGTTAVQLAVAMSHLKVVRLSLSCQLQCKLHCVILHFNSEFSHGLWLMARLHVYLQGVKRKPLHKGSSASTFSTFLTKGSRLD